MGSKVRYCMLFFVLFEFGCSNIEVEGTDVEFREFAVAASDTEPGTFIISSELEWEEFVAKYVSPSHLPNKTDFNKETVIGVSWGGGCRYSGCSFGKLIQKVESSNGVTIVRLNQLQIIGPCDMCLEPLQFVLVPKSEYSVIFAGAVPK